MAQLLLQHGADPTQQNDEGKPALEEATDSELKKLMESYLPRLRGRRNSQSAQMPLQVCDNEAPSTSSAQAAVDTDKPTASLPCPSKRNCSGQTQLQVAAMKGDLSLVKEHLRVWKCFNKRRVNLSDYAG
ncbi:hypothetical protein AOXY_G37003 [Acipenser oxyrinchus oxyrinchus]|uniref:Uncharacterized protein n=1 Tax=Acipenser oxyrinchus oxyrinchus TaxID=40147 RepID=A0AAD8CE56_ACIOX|nr:hypothetical protein AOXY_G37003 [Acipenser oxyrinchus oxyrinchus]